MKLADLFIGKRLFVGCGKPAALGKGEEEIRGSAYIEGPVQIGTDSEYSDVEATLMVGHEYNTDSDTHPDKAIKAKGNVEIIGNTNQEGDTTQDGNITATDNITTNAHFVGDITKTSGTPPGCKLFDIQHPSKKDYRLAHGCIEGPEAGVYHRGRVRNTSQIPLPSYWDGLVDFESITVQLTPIGAHQNVIVKRWDRKNIYLQPQGGMPIDCFYHIIAERTDVDKLIVEYKGETPADYPGNNSQYSIAGYNYDVRT